MGYTTMSKIEKLERLIWTNNIPNIIYACTAYALIASDYRFYMVEWHGDEPTGFSRFEFTGLISRAYEIRLIYKLGNIIMALEADEWVLVFQRD